MSTPKRSIDPSVRIAVVEDVLAGTLGARQAARSAGVHENSVYRWRDQYVAAGRGALEGEGAQVRVAGRSQDSATVRDLTLALGEAHAELSALRRRV